MTELINANFFERHHAVAVAALALEGVEHLVEHGALRLFARDDLRVLLGRVVHPQVVVFEHIHYIRRAW